MPSERRARTSSGSPRRASSSRTLSVAIRTGSSPLTRIPSGPSFAGERLDHAGQAGEQTVGDCEFRERYAHRRGEDEHDRDARPGHGAANATAIAAAPAAASVRASRTAPRKTLSNADRHASSVVVAMVPGGDPPTLMSAPSTPPNRSLATAISRSGVPGSALSATTQATASGDAESCVRRAVADDAVASCGALSTTRAPSATSTSAAANPRPRLPPVTMYTLSRSPRSTRPFCPKSRPGLQRRGATSRVEPFGVAALYVP